MAGAARSGVPPLASAWAWASRGASPWPSSPLPCCSSSAPGREAQRLLRLQLTVAPGQELFRLALRGGPEAGAEASLVEYGLREISYEPKTPTCHELKVLASPEHPLALHFEDEKEARRWWGVLSSSLREVHKARQSLHPSPAANSLPVSEPEASPSKLTQKEALALGLSAAIECGDKESATRCATTLAQQQAALRILLKESCYPRSEISMKVGVEDATCSATITIQVHAYTTIAALKQQVFQDYGFHPSVQRWIIGQCLCVDNRTIGSYGIQKDGDMAFLYLLSARCANLSEQRYREDQDWMVQQPAPSPCLDCSSIRHKPSTLPHLLPKKGVKDPSRQMDSGDISSQLASLQLNSLSPSLPAQDLPVPAPAPLSPVQDGWACPTCTFINKPTRPGCEMCSTDRPATYIVPGGYRPDESERLRMQQEKEGILQYQQEKGRREDGSAMPRTHSLGSLDDFIHLSMEFS